MIKRGQLKRLPSTPGVYLFKFGREILYIGKATNLRARVQSYFRGDIGTTRGERIVNLVQQATRVDARPTSSVLEALVLEAALIKKHQPKYNAREKDDSSFLFVVITKEAWPRVLLIRGKDLVEYKKATTFGPFPQSREIKVALKLIRKIFPFRDRCTPESKKPCFNYQINLCPGVCAGKISQSDYKLIIKHLRLFFAGKQKQLLRDLEKEMKKLAREQRFEQAEVAKRQIFALKHIQDVALISEENIKVTEGGEKKLRLEAYDVAHLGGQNSVGVMVVAQGSELMPSQYRKFILRTARAGDDVGALREILERRANHPEWPAADLVVIDGGRAQLSVAKKFFPHAVSVVKDERHRPRQILGPKNLVHEYEKSIILANHEAHRFAIAYHRSKRRVTP